MKKINKLGLVAITALLATGCGPTSTPSGPTNPDVDPTNPVVDEGDIVRDDNGSIIFNDVTIKLWSVTTGDDAGTQDEIISSFNELYNGMIKVETTHISRYDMEQLLQTSMDFDRQNAPDMLLSHGSRANEYVEREWLQPIDTWAEVAGIPIDKNDYVESLLNSVTIKDSIYGLPLDVHSTMIVARKDILDKNNLPMPTDFASLVSVCEQAINMAANGELWIRGENTEGSAKDEWRKASKIDQYCPFPMSYGDMWVHEFLSYTVALQNGGTFINSDGYPAWNTPEVASGLELLRGILNPTSTTVNTLPLSKNFGADYDVGDTPLRSGNALFKFQGPWAWQTEMNTFETMLKNDGGASNIVTIPLSNLFANDTSKAYASKIKGEGHAFMLMTTVESATKKAAAATFADYMVNYSGIEWAKRGHLPALKSVELSSDYKEDPAYDAYIKNWGTCDDYVVIPATPYYSTIDASYKDAVNKVMAKDFMNRSVTEILQECYDECVAYIELF